MKKIIFGLFAVMSAFTYAQEIDLWEESSPTISMGYTGFEIGGKYHNKSIKNVNEIQRFLDEVYSVKSTINNDLKERAMVDTQEKDWILNADVGYLKYEDLKTPIYSINYGVLSDVTRYGLSISMFDGDSKLKVREYDTTGGQVNLYFNRNEELGNLFGTLYIGKNKQEFKENAGNIDNLYYGYFTSLEQKYESFDVDEFYSGYFLNLDVSRTEADRNEELGNLFGTLYIGKNKQEFKENAGNIDNLYYGYFTSLEQKYESFDVDEFYSGYFLNLDVSRTEADYNLTYDGKTLKAKTDNDSIDTELGILFEKKLYVAMDTQISVKLASSIGKEFKDEDKYKELGKDEFEFYNRNKLEITSKVGTGADIFAGGADIFAGVEYKKSIVTSNSENNIYVGFKINF